MNKINYNGPINPLSFGNVSYNFLKHLYRKEIEVCYFPIGNNLDFSAFDKAEDDFKKWVYSSYENRYKNLSSDSPSLRMWHINGSDIRYGKRQFLYTFYECDQPTLIEKNLCNYQDKTIFSSSHAKKIFKENGCDNSEYIPIGFDEDFHETGKIYLEDKVSFGIVGKFEKRKHTARILKLWADKYGDNDKYQLTCSITNPFFKKEQQNSLILKALEGKMYKNINLLPFVKTNTEMNEVYNAIDINLSGLSGAEGWNLPAFNSTCLGKWSIILNSTSHKDWANDENSILINPSDQEDIYDKIFFTEGEDYNQGTMSTFTDDQFYEACELAEKKNKQKNKKGVELIKQFNYNKTIDKILELMQS
tara:strand:- start:31780 stop:32865 length:1086 start_codon:yes stop_codon:yes gene_type:complete